MSNTVVVNVADIERERPGFSFLTEGKKSKGKLEKQAQRLRRVSPCFSYNNKKRSNGYSYVNIYSFACIDFKASLAVQEKLRMHRFGSLKEVI